MAGVYADGMGFRYSHWIRRWTAEIDPTLRSKSPETSRQRDHVGQDALPCTAKIPPCLLGLSFVGS
jgi:hypothetical protein